MHKQVYEKYRICDDFKSSYSVKNLFLLYNWELNARSSRFWFYVQKVEKCLHVYVYNVWVLRNKDTDRIVYHQ